MLGTTLTAYNEEGSQYNLQHPRIVFLLWSLCIQMRVDRHGSSFPLPVLTRRQYKNRCAALFAPAEPVMYSG